MNQDEALPITPVDQLGCGSVRPVDVPALSRFVDDLWFGRGHQDMPLRIERTYHRRRRQTALGRLTPIEFEMIMNPEAATQAA